MNTKQKALAMELLPNMKKINAITLMREYQFVYGEMINWHEFSSLLDHLHTIKLVEVSGFTSDGMTEYKLINPGGLR